MDTAVGPSEEYINFALGFRTAAYGASTIYSDDQAFQAGKNDGKLLYPARNPISGDIVRAAYEKWRDGK